MGIHLGEAAETASGPVGYDVHRAARVASVAHGGQILLSSAAVEVLRDSLPDGAVLRDLGLHRLKDLSRPEHIYQLEAPGLRRDFAPLRSLDNPALANNLPAQSSRFIGRARELAELRPLIESHRLVTLVGAGGAGKTRLALQVLAELLDGSGDGVWLVELAGVADEDAVTPTIAEAMHVAPQPDRPMLESLVEALAPQRMLILLDKLRASDRCVRKDGRYPRAALSAPARALYEPVEPLGIAGRRSTGCLHSAPRRRRGGCAALRRVARSSSTGR